MRSAASGSFRDARHDGAGQASAATSAKTTATPSPEPYRLGREAAFEERKRNKAFAAHAKRRVKQIARAQKALYNDRGRS